MSTTARTQAEIARENGIHKSTISRRKARGAPLDAPALAGNPNALAHRIATGRTVAPTPARGEALSPGSEVTRARLAAGLSQVALAKLAGLSQPTLSRVERDQGTPAALAAAQSALGLAPIETR